MQSIPDTYWHSDYEFTLLKRNEKAALYQCTAMRGPHMRKAGFEVHRIRIAEPGEFRGKLLPEREILASNQEWGEFGWSYMASNYKGALVKFNSL